MIIKVPVYFELVKDSEAKIANVELYQETIRQQLDEHLRGSDFKLAGSWFDSNRIKAKHLTVNEALEKLRTKK
jgi:hypothetical protein